jgi:hypothetical protein
MLTTVFLFSSFLFSLFPCAACSFTAIVVAVGADPLLYSVSDYAFVRIEQTLIGILVLLVINSCVFPLRASALLHQEMMRNLERIKHAFVYSFSKYQQRAAQYKQRAEAMGSGEYAALTMHSPASMPSLERLENGELHLHMEALKLSAMPPLSAADMAAATAPAPSLLSELNPAHSFRKLGTLMYSSCDTQNALRTSAADEPSFWRAPLPVQAYTRVSELQRNVCFFLYGMDLALQRIAQSNARFNRFADSVALASDLNVLFVRLKSSVRSSLVLILHGLRSYDPPSSPPLSASESAECAESLSAGSAGLLSLHSSLDELNSRYKAWIDQRILAKRNFGAELDAVNQEGKEAAEEEPVEEHPPESEQELSPVARTDAKGVIGRVSVNVEDEQSPMDAPETRNVSAARSPPRQHIPLVPVTLYTPVLAPRRRFGTQTSYSFTIQPLHLDTHTLPDAAVENSLLAAPALTYGTQQQQQQQAERSMARAGAHAQWHSGAGVATSQLRPRKLQHPASAPLADAAITTADVPAGVPPSLAPPPSNSNSGPGSTHLSLTSLPALGQLAASFSRSMDVLAINAFLYATTGLIREIMALSQAVRVLLHMRKPGVFEETF